MANSDISFDDVLFNYEKHYVHQQLSSKIEIKSSQTFLRLLKFNLHWTKPYIVIAVLLTYLLLLDFSEKRN